MKRNVKIWFLVLCLVGCLFSVTVQASPCSHEKDEDLRYDETAHWEACQKCGWELSAKEAHIFTDNICDVCGYNLDAEVFASGTSTDGFAWSLDTNGVLTISGEGSMNNYADWSGFKDKVRKVVLDGAITSIGNNYFSGCGNLETIVIPDTVTSIGASAFWNCSSLQQMLLPDGVKMIRSDAFSGCTSLRSIQLPAELTLIERTAFAECTALEEIIIPSGVREIKYSAFRNCSNLKGITLPAAASFSAEVSEESIYRIFEGCSSLTEILVDEANENFSSQEGVLYNKAKTILYICPDGKQEACPCRKRWEKS